MAQTTDVRLRARLRRLGLSNAAISAAWPRWWSAEANTSRSAQAELAFTVARRLGLDARSLLEEAEAPRFLWRTEARFKRLSGESELEREGLTSFGRSVASALIGASPPPAADLAGVPALALREQLLSQRPFIGLLDLLTLAWSLGIPIVHLRVLPWPRKRMAAMTVRVGDRTAVLLARDSGYPASTAFYVSHELGHIALGQVTAGSAVVDLEDGHRPLATGDAEERSADEFALALLTGEPRLAVRAAGGVRASGAELARTALSSATDLRIEPGTLAEIYGYSTGEWRTVAVALRRIYGPATPVWAAINAVARQQLVFGRVSEDTADFLEAVLGEARV
jgi:hypothetical protein